MADPFFSSPDGSLRAQWLPYQGLIDLRCDDAAIALIQDSLQIELPRLANRYVTAGDVSVFWMAPSHWLIGVSEPQEKKFSAMLIKLRSAGNSENLSGQAAVTVVSDAYVGLRLTGSGAARLLAEGCPLNLELLGPDCCARSVMARAQVMLIVLQNAVGFDLLVDRSHADYVQQWIMSAA